MKDIKDMFLEIFAGDIFLGIEDVLGKSLFSGDYEPAGDFVQNVYTNFMVPVALSLLIIYFCISIMEKTTNEQFTYEQLFLLLAKLVIGIFVIDKGYEILTELYNAGIDIFNKFIAFAADPDYGIKPGSSQFEKHLPALWEALTGVDWNDGKELGFIDNIKTLLGGGLAILLAYGITLIVKGIVYVVAFLRIFEIYVRMMFAPIAFADFFYNGLNSAGFRFLKNFLAVSLQITVIYGSLLMYSVLAGVLVVPEGGDVSETAFLFMYIGLTCAAIGIIMKSQSLIKEFIGAN